MPVPALRSMVLLKIWSNAVGVGRLAASVATLSVEFSVWTIPSPRPRAMMLLEMTGPGTKYADALNCGLALFTSTLDICWPLEFSTRFWFGVTNRADWDGMVAPMLALVPVTRKSLRLMPAVAD